MLGFTEERSKVIEDDTTIYEVDLDCFECLPEEERRQYYGMEYQKNWKAGEGVVK